MHEKYCIIGLWHVITKIAMSKKADNIYVLWEIYLLSHCSFLMEDAVFAFFYYLTPTDLPFYEISSLLLLFEMEFIYCYYSRWNSEGMQLKRKGSLR